MKYRADIDGLRSVAIIPVVLYHAGISMFSGGFVGVDVFFVISGYLITSIILNDIDKEKFTITSFYFRRIKRIFPALYFVFAVLIFFCYLFLIPVDFASFGKSLASSVMFVSNIFFWKSSGYFDDAAELIPLLHTWSLSVEEQFYIFYPVMLLLIAKFLRKKYIFPVFFVAVISFLLCVWLTPSRTVASFFLLPTRTWELMLGALVALRFFPKCNNVKILNLFSVLGLGMILYSIFRYDSSTIFPGYSAVIPCAGTALIIYSGSFISESGLVSKPIVNRFLSLKPFVLIGLISYSWYLWHWVLFVFRNYYNEVTVESFFKTNLFIILISLVLSVISYFVIEKPFREVQWKNRYVLFAVSIIIMAVFASAGMLIGKQNGFPSRFKPEVADLSSVSSEGRKKAEYFERSSFTLNKDNPYIIGSVDTVPTFALIGDSHAWSLSYGFDSIAGKEQRSGVLISLNSCPPVLDILPENRYDCSSFNNNGVELIRSYETVKTVFLGGRWASYVHFGRKFAGKDSTKEQRISMLTDGLSKMINRLESGGVQVVLLSEVPGSKYDVPLSLAKMFAAEQLFGKLYRQVEVRQTLTHFMQEQEPVREIFHVLQSKHPDLKIISLHEALCDGYFCEVETDKKALYYDSNHLSSYGAEYVCSQLKEKITPFF